VQSEALLAEVAAARQGLECADGAYNTALDRLEVRICVRVCVRKQQHVHSMAWQQSTSTSMTPWPSGRSGNTLHCVPPCAPGLSCSGHAG
jgi:hypothetical protein